MSKHPSRKRTKPNPPQQEIHPDAQRRFEKAVDAAVKSGPIHRKPRAK